MEIKTLHGRFKFKLQRFNNGEDYFSLTGQCLDGYVSERLAEYAAYYSNRMSYEEVAGLIERNTGEQLLSDQSIWRIVVAKAAQISEKQRQQVAKRLKKGKLPAVASQVDIYNPQQSEVLLFDDGIEVKEQKAKRDHKEVEQKTRVNTDVVMLEKRNGTYQYLTAGIDQQGKEVVSLEECVKAELISEYSRRKTALPIVAITDGAKSIRNSLLIIFGVALTIILDWYHLHKKVTEFFSMIALNKNEKKKHLDFIFSCLWKGETERVLTYLTTEVVGRNPARLQELIIYLQKHEAEIINYERRQQAGKTIGSGRMEKGVDQVIGKRQKDNAMSWSRKGSKALAILKVAELNHQWDSLWNFAPLAA